MNTFRVKQFVQDAFARLGYELRRKRPTFRPYVKQISLLGVTFSFWVADPTAEGWYNLELHKDLAVAENTEMARLVQRGDRVLELGSHHGFFAMLISRLVGPQGFVLAVEPSPFNALVAAAQAGLNRATNCQVLQAAASVRNGAVRISADSNAFVLSGSASGGIEVPAFTVDELDSKFGPFDVLKIDVEGFEQQVLAGAAKTLECHPKLLLELHTPHLARFGSTADSILNLLGPSYRGTFVARDARTSIRRFPEEKLPTTIVNLFLEHCGHG
jgi:FkbM family methyltransferase